MNPAELLALANRLRYACRDPVTGEPLYAGVSADACVEDDEALEALEALLADHQRALRLLDEVREWIRGDVAGGACWPVDRFTRAELLARIDAELEGEK